MNRAEIVVEQLAASLGQENCLEVLGQICQTLPQRIPPAEVERYWPNLSSEMRICICLPPLLTAIRTYTEMQIPTVSKTVLLEEGVVFLLKAIAQWDSACKKDEHLSLKQHVALTVHTGLKQVISHRHGLGIKNFPVVAFYWQCWSEFFTRNGRPPSLTEISDIMEKTKPPEMSLKNSVQGEEKSRVVIIFEAARRSPTKTVSLHCSPAPDPIASAEADERARIICGLLATLKSRQAQVIRMRFGLDDGQEMTLEKVGEIMGLTAESIRRIEGVALRRLRHPIRARKIADYVDSAPAWLTELETDVKL